MDLTVLTALVPAGIEVFKNIGNALSRRIIPKDVEPRTFEEAVKLRELDLEQFKVVQNADAGGETYRWVEAARKLQRPAVVYGIFGWAALHMSIFTPEFIQTLVESVLWFLFGDRSLSYLKRGR